MRAIFYLEEVDEVLGKGGEGLLITELESLMLARASGRVVLMATIVGADSADVVRVHPDWLHKDLRAYLVRYANEPLIDLRHFIEPKRRYKLVVPPANAGIVINPTHQFKTREDAERVLAILRATNKDSLGPEKKLVLAYENENGDFEEVE
jgi:hypothetical protein